MRKLVLSALMLALALVGAAPAYAQQQGAAKPYVSGDTSNAPPGTSGVVVGTVTEISGPVVLVEVDPAAESGDKGYFTVTEETEITKLDGDAVVPAALEDLEVGQRVEAAYAGAIAESYPPQGNAASIAILEDGPPPVEEEIPVTGVIGPLTDHPDARHGITDEATSQFYALKSDAVDLDAYAGDGRRVTVYGHVVPTTDGGPPLLDVGRVEPLDGPGEGESVAVAFELAVEGEPPAGATFFASLGYEPAFFPLTDPDGDGLYAAAAPEGYVAAGDTLPARIVQGTGTRGSQVSGTAPGEPSRTIKDFGEVRFDEDTTLSAEVSFGGEEPPPPGRSATLAFKLAVECEPPEGATFFGNVQTGEGGPGIFAELLDPDGDGLYVGIATLPDRFAPGPAPEGTKPVSLPVRVLQGTGTRPGGAGALPGEPTSVVRDFGAVPMEAENVFPAEASFCDGTGPVGSGDSNDDEGGAVPGGGGSEGGAFGGIKTLPATGGGLLVAGLAGLALIAGGLLVRRIVR